MNKKMLKSLNKLREKYSKILNDIDGTIEKVAKEKFEERGAIFHKDLGIGLFKEFDVNYNSELELWACYLDEKEDKAQTIRSTIENLMPQTEASKVLYDE